MEPVPRNALQLKALFSKWGKVVEAHVATNRDTGASRGFGFIHYQTSAEAAAAIAELNGKKTLPGCPKPMKVRLADEPKSERQRSTHNAASSAGSTELYVSMINRTASQADVQAVFQKFGPVESVFLFNKGGQFTGSAKVTMPSDAAHAAIKKMHHKFQFPGAPHKATVQLFKGSSSAPGSAAAASSLAAHSGTKHRPVDSGSAAHTDTVHKRSRANSHGAAGRGVKVYVYNLPLQLTDQGLTQTFQPFGDVADARVYTQDDGSSVGAGFLVFRTAQAADLAVEAMDGSGMEGRTLRVMLAA